MPVPYVVIARPNPRDREAPKKFYAQVKSAGEVTLRELADQIAQRSTLNSIDTMAMLEALIQVVPKMLVAGSIVRLGEFGSFSLSINSEGVEKEEQFTAANITDCSMNFRPGKEVAKVLDTASFVKASK